MRDVLELCNKAEMDHPLFNGKVITVRAIFSGRIIHCKQPQLLMRPAQCIYAALVVTLTQVILLESRNLYVNKNVGMSCWVALMRET